MTATLTTRKQPDITEEQIDAASRIIGPDGQVFYLVQSASDFEVEYAVRTVRINGQAHLTCTCAAGRLGRACWHKRAVLYHNAEYELNTRDLAEREKREQRRAEEAEEERQYRQWLRDHGYPERLDRQSYEVEFGIYQ